MDNRLHFLKIVVPFNLLPDEVLVTTAALLIEVRFQKDGIIYRQAVSKLKGIDIIVEDEYETFLFDSNQHKRLIEIYHRGEYYGGITKLLIEKDLCERWLQKKAPSCTLYPVGLSTSCVKHTSSSTSTSHTPSDKKCSMKSLPIFIRISPISRAVL